MSTILSDSEFPTNSKFWTKVLKCTVPKRVHIIGTGAYRDLFGVLGPYLYFRVPIFGVLGPYLYFKGPYFHTLHFRWTQVQKKFHSKFQCHLIFFCFRFPKTLMLKSLSGGILRKYNFCHFKKAHF